MAVLVAGGAGYIGSHTAVQLISEGYDVVVADNFYNSNPSVIDRMKTIVNKDFKFYEIDLLDRVSVEQIFKDNKIDVVIDFAALKAVGESVKIPLRYYHDNLNILLNLCEMMNKYDAKKIIFSSSACVYGQSEINPITEDFPDKPINPYGRTKLTSELILKDLCNSDSSWSAVILRYFNPIGAHESGLIGEESRGIPNNLMPFIEKVASHEIECLNVFGNDYPTPDGTCVRDYIHVVDLAIAHIKAIKALESSGAHVYNLGTGTGYSVLDIINTFEKVNNIKLNYKFADRRDGDAAVCYANPTKAYNELGWKAERDLAKMCKDSWNWKQGGLNKNV